MDGEATMFFANGDRYIGQWKRGEMSGMGVILNINDRNTNL